MKKSCSILFNNPLALFVLFLFVAYLPVFLPFFHLKNDLITQNLPTRFVISESVYSGYFPWWNPYIYFGIPQYGDMNNGFWNPFVWIISKTVGYNMWSITLEEMFYILIGGWGIYKICKEFFSKETSILTGFAYMACGYMVGHLQHFCWITGTGFSPYVLLFFIRMNKNPIVKNFILGSFATFFFLSSTHPGLIIGALYFFLFFLLLIWLNRKNTGNILYRKNFWLINSLFLLCSLLVSAVVITSNMDVLQHISRGLELDREQMLLNPTTFQSYLSLFNPLPVHKSDYFDTDISMRNVYIGIASLFGLVAFIKVYLKKSLLSIAIALIFFILLSAGGVFKIFFSKFIPLVGYVRMNGEFTYFVVLILLLLSAAGLDRVFKEGFPARFANQFLSVAVWTFGISAILSTTFIIATGQFFVFENFISVTHSVSTTIKYFIDNLSFSWLFLVGSLLQLTTLLLIKKRLNNKPFTAFVLVLNLIIHVWLILPYTGLGMKSKKELNDAITVSEKGIHAAELISLNKTVYLDSITTNDVWMSSSYSKKIGFNSKELYPVQLRNSQAFFGDPLVFKFIMNQSYLFLSTDTTIQSKTSFDSSSIKVLSFAPGYVKVSVVADEYNYLTLLQNNYPYWKVKINDIETPHLTGYKTFITTALPEKNSIVEFIFDPKPIRIALWISICATILGCIILLNKKWRNKMVFT